MAKALKYTLKVWFTTALTSPIILFAIDYMCSTTSSFERFEDILGIYPIIVFASLLFSCFTWILFFVCVYNLLKIYLPEKLYKPIIQLAGLLLALLTFVVLVAVHDSEITMIATQLFWLIAAPYLLCLFLSIQLYKLPELYMNHQQNSTT